MSEAVINVAKDFSPYPAGRTRGQFSGQKFRTSFLVPQLKKFDMVQIVFDGVAGLPSSFLEEAFGGLVREGLIGSIEEFRNRIRIVATDDAILDTNKIVFDYVSDALN